MNWKPVYLNNVSTKSLLSLEGLIGIEECTNYDIDANLHTQSNLHNKNCKTDRKHKRKIKNKTLLPIQHSSLAVIESDVTPSKVGSTSDRNGTCFQISIEDNSTFKDIVSVENMKSWTNLPLQESLLRALALLKFTEPTRIQSLTLPAAILGKRDILGAAETGSGKTLAFGLPILYGVLKLKNEEKGRQDRNENHKLENELDDGQITERKFDDEGIGLVKYENNIEIPNLIPKEPLYALILTPTRELAFQIKQHLSSLAYFTDMNIAAVVGGMSIEKQLRILNKGPEIVVATPGRLWELIEDGHPHLSQVDSVKFLAIDETDRMLEKDHFKELHQILERINVNREWMRQRQNFVFSATLTLTHELPKHLVKKKKIKMDRRIYDMSPAKKLQKIIEKMNITNPKIVDITQGKGMSETLTECRITCSIDEKDYYVYYFLLKHPGRTLIFCNSIGCVRRLVTILTLLNCNPLPLHSSLQQRQRLKNLDRFKEDENGVLIATDIAARGLDIASIQHVIHYQTPRTSESYVHRSGRTARLSKEGITVLLVEPGELQHYLRFCRNLGKMEDLPQFPVEANLLNTIKEAVNLARDLDKLELNIRKSTSEAGWIQKAAAEMDILLDNSLHERDPRELKSYKKTAEVKRRKLCSLLQNSLFMRNLGIKYHWKPGQMNVQSIQAPPQCISAIEIMKNALKTNTAKKSIRTKRLFKYKLKKNIWQTT